MTFGGLQKFTLIDYPGKVACTVFTLGCNFRCPFCHNPELVLVKGVENRANDKQEKDFFEFLGKRRGKLEGVCITGGEPIIQPDILDFMRKIKKAGFAVKLDTNGTRPDILKKAYQEKLVDFVAMDIKSSLSNYKKACGISVDTKRIKLSAELIMRSKIPYEFRTTVVPYLHSYKDFERIGRWLRGAKHYTLQQYEDQGKILDEKLRQRIKGAKMNMKKIKKSVEKYFEQVEIRE